LDTLDLTGYGLSDIEIYEILIYLKPVKRVKGLKLVKNKLTNEGLAKIIEFIPNVTNINLSFNQLGDEAISALLNNRSKIPYLRIINLSNNKINERKTKNAID
jgi:Ran GTPase-activating protein (RanGAP) involved in mRNA processing and transport